MGLPLACLVLLWSPYVFLFAFGLVYALVRAVRAGRESTRTAWLAGAGACAALVAAEITCFALGARVFWAPLFSYDRELGYGNMFEDTQQRQEFGGTRRTPASVRDADCRVVFFGGSFANGAGLEDDETLPNAFAASARQPVASYNFAISGYGAHHMLRMLEVGRVEEVTGPSFDHAIYVAIPHHVYRATGKVPWDLSGPLYAPRGDAGVRFQGPSFPWPLAWLLYQAQRSYTGSFVLQRTLLRTVLGPEDYERYVGIVRETQRLLSRLYGASFRVVAWRDDSGEVVDLLRSAGLRVHAVDEIVPELAEDPDAYLLADGHPNARTNARIGAFLARTLEQENGGRVCRAPR